MNTSRIEGKSFKTAIGPALLYKIEFWAAKKQQRINVAGKRMLKWMSGKTRKDRVETIAFLGA